MTHSRKLFADTSYFYAVFDGNDQNHAQAMQYSQYVANKNIGLICSWEIIVETVTLLLYRFNAISSREFIKNVLPGLEIIYIDDSVRTKALTQFQKYSKDKKISLCDVISSVLIKDHLHHLKCLAFDDDFGRLGLDILTRHDMADEMTH